MLKEGVKFKHVILLIILVGIIIRVYLVFNCNTDVDGTFYIVMGRGFKERGEFVLTWGDFGQNVNTNSTSNSYSHHFSPGFAFYLFTFYQLFGYSFEITKIASMILSLIFLLVCYFTTKNLYGKNKALVVTAFFAVYFDLIWSARVIYSENLLMIFFMLTMWGIIRGIEDDRYMVLAGIFAGLGYLTKASVGYFFIIAGILGFIWRFYYMRWDVFKKKYYLIAIVIFLFIVGAWALRNILIFGFPNWQTSYYVEHAVKYSVGHPTQYLITIMYSFWTFLILLLAIALFFGKELKSTMRKVMDEHYSGLWLSVIIVILLGIFISGAFTMIEQGKMFLYERVRYVMVAFIPITWLFVKDTNFQMEKKLKFVRIKEIIQWIKRTLLDTNKLIILLLVLLIAISIYALIDYRILVLFIIFGGFSLTIKNPRKRLLILLILLLIISVNTVTEVRHTGWEALGKDLKNHINEGDTVAISITGLPFECEKYRFYPYVQDVNFNITKYNDGCEVDWIVSNHRVHNDNYTLYREYKNHNRKGIFLLSTYLIMKGQSMDEYNERGPSHFLYKHLPSDQSG